MLEARGLTKYYSAIPAVRDVSFRVGAGAILGILGPNGSGKSTAVSIVTGLLEPSGGAVTYNGRNIRYDLLTCTYLPGPSGGEDALAVVLRGFHRVHLLDGGPGAAHDPPSSMAPPLHRRRRVRPGRDAPAAAAMARVEPGLRFVEDDPGALFEGFHLSEELAAHSDLPADRT